MEGYKYITLPCKYEDIKDLKAGDKVLVSGVLYTARDQAHMRLLEDMKNNKELAFEVEGAGIYYCGPTPARPEMVVGAIGPTTSYRMDDLTVPLLEKGLKVMIGKGKRNQTVQDGIVKHKAVYLCAIGGAGALYADCIKECKVIAYEDLMAEAVHRLVVKDFPAVVAIDTMGNKMDI